MKKTTWLTLFLPLLFSLHACHPYFRPSSVQYSGYNIQQSSRDTVMTGLLQPYAQKVNETMNDVVAELGTTLVKQSPDGSLGSFLADSYLTMARKKFDPAADVAFINSGGIRLNNIQAGPLKRGTIYEVMPFDNQMVVLKLTGQQLQAYLDHVASEGGCGIAGIRMKIRQKKAVDVFIGGRPLDPSAIYTMVNSDYTVNGGGGFSGLRAIPANVTGYLLRDATLDYCSLFKTEGRPILISNEKRITNAQ
jgi:2',3'-cyclic-nucleotide 2'-phosphodiesterase (5'-nucleotidase family)